MKKKDELLIERIRSATTIVAATSQSSTKASICKLEQAAVRFLMEQYEDATSTPATKWPAVDNGSDENQD